jgi:hypothetical protein
MYLQYEIIIEDTTHEFEDQIRVIENVYSYLHILTFTPFRIKYEKRCKTPIFIIVSLII